MISSYIVLPMKSMGRMVAFESLDRTWNLIPNGGDQIWSSDLPGRSLRCPHLLFSLAWVTRSQRHARAPGPSPLLGCYLGQSGNVQQHAVVFIKPLTKQILFFRSGEQNEPCCWITSKVPTAA